MGFLRRVSIPETQFAHPENEGCKNSKQRDCDSQPLKCCYQVGGLREEGRLHLRKPQRVLLYSTAWHCLEDCPQSYWPRNINCQHAKSEYIAQEQIY